MNEEEKLAKKSLPILRSSFTAVGLSAAFHGRHATSHINFELRRSRIRWHTLALLEKKLHLCSDGIRVCVIKYCGCKGIVDIDRAKALAILL